MSTELCARRYRLRMTRRFVRRHFPGALLAFAVSAAVLDNRVAGVVAAATLPVRLAARRLSDDVGPVIR